MSNNEIDLNITLSQLEANRRGFRKVIHKKFKDWTKKQLLDSFLELMYECDTKTILSIGNGAKWPMVAYRDGVTVVLSKFFRIRNTDHVLPGHATMKNYTKNMKKNPIAQAFRKNKEREGLN